MAGRARVGASRRLLVMSDASRIPDAPVLDVVDDGLSDEEIAARTAAWLDELRSKPPVRASETAAEALDRLYADGELGPRLSSTPRLRLSWSPGRRSDSRSQI